MPRLLQLIRNRSRNKSEVVIIPPSPSADSGVQQVVEDLTALSSTSQSSPSNNSSSTSSLFGRKKKQFRKGSSQIFRRGASSSSSKSQEKKSTSVFPSLEEVSQVSSLSSPFNSERNMQNERIVLLAPTLKLKKGSSKAVDKKKKTNISNDEALAKAKKEIAAKDAKIQYLDTLVKELKSVYAGKLDMKDMELSALRKELKDANEELSNTKENLADVMDGQNKLIEDVSKKAKEPNCWYPVLGSIQFN